MIYPSRGSFAATAAGLVVGLAAGYLIWSGSGFHEVTITECLGDPVTIAPARGWSPLGMDLVVATRDASGPYEIAIDGWAGDHVVAEPVGRHGSVSFSYTGQWLGPVELSVKGPEARCDVLALVRFRSVLRFQ